MSRETIVALGLATVVIGGGAYGVSVYQDVRSEEIRESRAERRAERRAEGLEQLRELREESARLIPAVLGDVALGMSLDEVRAIRGDGMVLDRRATEPGIQLWHERLPNGAEVMYGFEQRLGLLLQVQIMSLMPDVSGIAPHLRAMNEMYGTPTGIWDCPTTGDVPTRRFTWRLAETTVSDVFLIAGGRVSVTLYITTTERTAHSLHISSCHPATPEELETFPATDHIPTPDGEGG